MIRSWTRLGVSLVAYVLWDGAERLLSRCKRPAAPKPTPGHPTHHWKGEPVLDRVPASYEPNPLTHILSPDEWRALEADAKKGASHD